MIPTIQSLRGIFAFIIFLSHYTINDSPIFGAGGDLGVALFFILSGYGLSQGYSYRQSISLKEFILARLKKIYPLHILCMICAIVLFWQFNPWINFSNLILVQSWIPNRLYYFSDNSVSWFLSSLLFCYILFPFLSKQQRKSPKTFIKAYAVVMLFYVLCYLPELQYNLSSEEINYWAYIFPVARIFDFVFGMILYDISIRAEKAIHQISAVSVAIQWIIELLVLALIVVWIVMARFIPQCYVSALWWWIPEGVLIIMLFTMSQWKGPLSRILRLKPFVWFGNQSLSFYMLHLMIIRVIGIFIDKLNFEILPVGKFLFTIIVTILASAICERIIVGPTTRLISKKIRC